MNIIFFGSSSHVISVIKVLKKNFDLKLVITTEKSNLALPDSVRHLALQGETLQPPVINYCITNKIPYLSVQQFSNFQPKADPPLAETIQQLEKINPSAGVLADFGLIIPDKILNVFSKGIINIHPSLLPEYRGPTPVQTAILNGEKITGVSIMKLDEEIDHGPILGQEKEEILDTDTAETLYKRLFAKGANLLPKVLNLYLKDGLKPIPQNHAKATFTKTLKREDGFIDISNPPSKEILERMIKAYFPWPGVFTKIRIKNHELRIKFLPDKRIQVEGKKPVSYKDFLNGYPEFDEQIFLKLGLLDNHD